MQRRLATSPYHFRMDKVKSKMRDPDPTWLDVVGECYRKGVSLTASHM